MRYWVVAALAGIWAAGTVAAMELYVAPDGDDANTGTRQKPVATLQRALALRRTARAADAPPEDAPVADLIRLRGGRYPVGATIALSAADSGTPEAPLVIAAEPGEEPVITGGVSVPLAELKPMSDTALLARLPAAVRDQVLEIDLRSLSPEWSDPEPWPARFRGYAGWPELSVGGQRLHLARWPNRGYARIKKVLERGSRPRHNETPDRPGRFLFGEDEPTHWATDQEIYLSGYWCFKWYDECLRVAELDKQKHEIRFATPHFYGIGGPSGGLYYSINVLETLDTPGEYVYDRGRGRIYLLPPPGAPDRGCSVSLLRDPILQVDAVSGLRLQGLVLEHGCADAVTVTDSHDVRIAACTIQGFAKGGVVIRGGTNCGVSGCTLEELGTQGVSLNGGDRSSLTPAGHYATDNHIHDYALNVKTYQPGVGLSGVGNRAAHNYIHDCPHAAILFGGNDHMIEYNRVERVCLDAADSGAVYCGRDWTLHGTTIRQNWFSKLGQAAHHGNWCVYLDDQASGIEVAGNLISQTHSGMLIGGGRHNRIVDNVIAHCPGTSIRFDSRGLGWAGRNQNTMWERLGAVPYALEPWRSRFPKLMRTPAERPPAPIDNTVRNNLLIKSRGPSIDAVVSRRGSVTANPSPAVDWSPELKEGHLVAPPKGVDLPMNFAGVSFGPRPGAAVGRVFDVVVGDEAEPGLVVWRPVALRGDAGRGRYTLRGASEGFGVAADSGVVTVAGPMPPGSARPRHLEVWCDSPGQDSSPVADLYVRILKRKGAAVREPPRVVPPGGSFTGKIAVALEQWPALTPRRDVEIRYTLDGSDPTSASPRYETPIEVSSATTLKARAFCTGNAEAAPSAIAEAVFTPVVVPADGPLPLTAVQPARVWLHGELGVNRNYAGSGPATLGGKACRDSVLIHPEGAMGMLTYELQPLARQFRRFTARVGLDGAADKRGSCVFVVDVARAGTWAEAFKSDVLRVSSEPVPVNVELSDAERLRLRVLPTADGIDSDHAVWADARLE